MQVDFVLLLLYDAEGRFLLQHRDDDAPSYAGYWGFFGGGVEEGENAAQAMQREAFEELRYPLRSHTPRLVLPYCDEERGTHGTKYYFMESCPDKTTLELHEGQGMGWFYFSETATLKMRTVSRSALETLVRDIPRS